jgi:hypothetical protein
MTTTKTTAKPATTISKVAKGLYRVTDNATGATIGSIQPNSEGLTGWAFRDLTYRCLAARRTLAELKVAVEDLATERATQAG